MITIPVSVNNDFFKWQLDLMIYCHRSLYGDYKEKLYPVLVKESDSIPPQDVNGVEVKPFNQVWDIKENIICINSQLGLLQVIHNFHDDQVIEIVDFDMFHLGPHPEFTVGDDEIIVDGMYEDWHLKSKSSHKSVIEPYFYNNGDYYTGGYLPVIGKVKTIKKLLFPWIYYHVEIFRNSKDPNIQWWGGMYALQLACENERVQMINKDILYVPEINTLKENHYIAHYSVGSVFNKKIYRDINQIKMANLETLPDNQFYNLIKSWQKTL